MYFTNNTIEDITLVTLFKFSNLQDFVDKNINYESKQLRFFYQKFHKELFIKIILAPDKDAELVKIKLKFIIDKDEEINGNSNFDDKKTENSDFSDSSDFVPTQGNSKTRFNSKGKIDIAGINDLEEFPFDITFHCYNIEKGCYVKMNKEKFTLTNLKYIMPIDDYLKLDDLIYNKLIQPFVLRIKVSCVTKVPQKCADYVGISNEGNTCYMNSLVQMLHFLPNVNKVIFEQPYVEDSVISALQKIFFLLKTEKTPIKIPQLFQALGWERSFWNIQNDAAEIFSILFEILDRTVKENCNSNLFFNLSDLFEGSLQNTIVCNNVESKTVENFLFLGVPLEVN
jgi:hypothetical protein